MSVAVLSLTSDFIKSCKEDCLFTCTCIFLSLIKFLYIFQAQTQLCGPGGIFPGLLGLENGIFGPGLQLGPLTQSNYAPGAPCQLGPPCGIQVPNCGVGPGCVQAPPCGVQVHPCGVQVPPCGIQVPPCGLQVPPYGVQVPPCGVQVPPCGVQVPPCGVQVPPCGVQVPPCGVQVPPCGIQVPSCGIQVPSYGMQVPSCGVQVPSCSVQVPSCGVQAPIINNIVPSFIPNQCGQCSAYAPTISPIVPSICDYSPNPVTTVIDNTLANSLANALQLLIVSNLLESTFAGSNTPYPVCETVNPYCGNVIEILTPDYYPCNNVVACEPVYEAIVTPCLEVPCYQENKVSYAPCLEINPCGQIFGQELALDKINPYSRSFGCLDNCGVNSLVNGFGCSDRGSFNSFNSYGCDNSLVNPYANFGVSDTCGSVNLFGNGFGCLDNIFSPVVAEALFPSEIPAQLVCNFGYMPNNVPCVSVNVEALPLESCSCY